MMVVYEDCLITPDGVWKYPSTEWALLVLRSCGVEQTPPPLEMWGLL